MQQKGETLHFFRLFGQSEVELQNIRTFGYSEVGELMFKRQIEKQLIKMSRSFPVVTLTGPRQSGKTTIVKHTFKDKPYANLEHLETREFAEADPTRFLAQF